MKKFFFIIALIFCFGLFSLVSAQGPSFEIVPVAEPTIENTNVSQTESVVTITAGAFDISGISSVVAVIKDFEGNKVNRLSLYDNGSFPDQEANDNIYTTSDSFSGYSPGTYTVDIFAVDSLGFTEYVENIGSFEVTITDFPQVTTHPASSIGTTTATGNGEITDVGGENCDEKGFEWGTTPGGPYPNEVTETGTFTESGFLIDITDLTPGTTYYYRAKAHNSAGWGYGEEESFSTLSQAGCTPGETKQCTSSQGCTHTITCSSGGVWPTCPTDACVANTSDSLDCSQSTFEGCIGNLSGIRDLYGDCDSNCQCTEDSFNYICIEGSCGAECDAGSDCSCPTDGCQGRDYYDYPEHGSCTSNCLCSIGTETGEPCEPTITSNDSRCISVPQVTTHPASSIGTTTATGNGEITDVGGENCDEKGFEWGTTPGGPYPNEVTETGTFTESGFLIDITDLTPGTTYYYRAKAHNSAGWGYGEEESFSTLSQVGTSPNCDSFSGASLCVNTETFIDLPPQCNSTVPDSVNVLQEFQIDVSGSTDDNGISQVRFKSDHIQNGTQKGEWTSWYSWNSSAVDWDSQRKTMNWNFPEAGDKEVWVELKDSRGQTSKCSDTITVSGTANCDSFSGAYLCF